MQAMIRCDGLDTYVESSDRIFHWVLAEGLSEPKACSPQAFRLRRYTKKCVRFASRKIKDLALITLDLSKLADVALACLDDSQQSTGYWVELLSFRCLQVKPASIMPLSQHFTEPAAVSATGYFGAE